MDKDKALEELKFCLNLWEEKGGCMFGGGTKCENCAAPYLMWKYVSGEVLHGNMKRLSLTDWKNKIEQIDIK